MARLQWRKALKIGKSERYGLDISSWLGSGEVTSFDVSPPVGSSLVISDALVSGSVISCLISGASEAGKFEIHFTYASVDRSDCQSVRLTTAEDC